MNGRKFLLWLSGTIALLSYSSLIYGLFPQTMWGHDVGLLLTIISTFVWGVIYYITLLFIKVQ